MGRGSPLVGRGQLEATLQGREGAFQFEAGFGGAAAKLEERKVVVGLAVEDAVERAEGAGKIVVDPLQVGAGKGTLVEVAARNAVPVDGA